VPLVGGGGLQKKFLSVHSYVNLRNVVVKNSG
jgi:hypothetical protein